MTKDQTIVRERMTSMSTPLLLFRGVDIISRKSKHVVRGRCCMRGRLCRSRRAICQAASLARSTWAKVTQTQESWLPCH